MEIYVVIDGNIHKSIYIYIYSYIDIIIHLGSRYLQDEAICRMQFVVN